MTIPLRRVSPVACEIEKTGSMRVPARLYLSEGLEAGAQDGSLEQLQNMASIPGVVAPCIAMPDVHIGYGFPVGGVAAFALKDGVISPGGIGFDINCGVRLLRTNLTKEHVEPVIEGLLEILSQSVPTGTGRASTIRLSHEDLREVLQHGSGWALAHGYATQDDLAVTEEQGCLRAADPNALSSRALDRGVNQLGTLGAGNHFLEVQVVERILDDKTAAVYGLKPDQVVIMIHCGSRGLGHQVCTDYLETFVASFPDIARSIPEKNLMYAPLSSPLAQAYYGAMCAAANFAWCNRQVITHFVRKACARLLPGAEVTVLYDVSHNIAKREYHSVAGQEQELMVHRKGATRSFGPGRCEVPQAYRAVGQPVLIPGSMGTASYVLAGTEQAMRETFGSSCHGAGRQLSRTAALREIKGEQVRRDLRSKGIAVIAPGRGLAEEAPQAYKDVDEVIRVVAEAGIAVPVARLKPLGVLKG